MKQHAGLAVNPTFIYVAVCVAFGSLFGVAVAVITSQPGKPAANLDVNVVHAQNGAKERTGTPAPKDLGSVNSSKDGLRGHLTTTWDGKFSYRLVVEPSDRARQAEFAGTVSDPPRPLSVHIQLKDFSGFPLCSQDIVVKYDDYKAFVRNAALSQRSGKARAGNGSQGLAEQGVDFDRLSAKEQERDQGKDIFQNDMGPDGQIETISAQGTIPCSRGAYENAAYWSFAPDFPTLAEQAELLKLQANTQVNAKASSSPALPGGKTPDARGVSADLRESGKHKISATPAKLNLIVAKGPANFNIEGDDAIVAFDASGGIIQTSGGKTFFIDKIGGGVNPARWQDAPASFHYQCDQNAVCTLTRAGAAVLHGKMKG